MVTQADAERRDRWLTQLDIHQRAAVPESKVFSPRAEPQPGI